MPESRPFTGILLMLCAVLCFSLQDVLSKYLAQTFPVLMLIWARYSVNFLGMLIFLVPSMGMKLFATKRPWSQVSRGLILVVMACFGLAGFKLAPLAEATAFIFISPFLVLLLARWLLREYVAMGRWLAVIAGFSGVLLIARPGGALSGQALLFLGIAACGYAFYQIYTRQLSTSESSITLLFYTSLVGTVSMTLGAPFYWSGPTPNTVQVLQIISIGLLNGAGHLLFNSAFRYASASTLSPFTFTQLIMAMLFGWLFYDHLPDELSIFGIAVIAASGISVVLSERFKRRPAPDTDTAC